MIRGSFRLLTGRLLIAAGGAASLDLGCCSAAAAQRTPFLTTRQALTLLSANDGASLSRWGGADVPSEADAMPDSITVIHLGPDHPPVTTTVYGTVPNTIYGSPHMAIAGAGRYGFVTNHSWRFEPETGQAGSAAALPSYRADILSVIDLSTDNLAVVDRIELPPNPWMAVTHPDGERVFVAGGSRFHIFRVVDEGIQRVAEIETPVTISSFDISPDGRLLLGTGTSESGADDASPSDLPGGIFLFRIRGNDLEYLHEVEPDEGIVIDGPFSPRFDPRGRLAIVLNGLGLSAKGRLDDVLLVDMTLERPRVTAAIPDVADGLESVAFHPDGDMAVVSCLGYANGIPEDSTLVSHLAVIDLSTDRASLLYYLPIEPIPEGIEFTPDGTQLFVGTTFANHIAVYEVDGRMLTRNPFVLRTGHGPSSLALAARFGR